MPAVYCRLGDEFRRMADELLQSPGARLRARLRWGRVTGPGLDDIM